jgi:cytochrome c-type biogenesis protein
MQLNLITAFIAGLITFFAPCTFTTLPSFLGYLSFKATGEDLRLDSKKYRIKVVLSALSYVAGFLLIFTLLGIAVSQLGTFLAQNKQLFTRLGGLVIIGFGLFILIGERFSNLNFMFQERKIRLKTRHFFDDSYVFPFVLGLTSAFAWTPCIGPVLGSILLLASGTGSVFQGGLLLFVYALGINIPFLLISLFVGSSQKFVKKFRKTAVILHKLSAWLMILLGLILLLGISDIIFAFLYRTFVAFGYSPA